MARRIPGEFVPSDVNTANDPAIMRAGAWAELLFRRANEHAKRNHRDGTLHEVELRVIALGIPGRALTHAEALVREGLWEPLEGGGWYIRSYLKWNLSELEQAEVRAQKRRGAAATNHKKGAHSERPDIECPLCQEVAANAQI